MPVEKIDPYTKREVLRQNKERKLWNDHDTPQNILVRFMLEYGELVQAMEDTPEIAYLIASEIGDLFYLAIKYQSMFEEGTELPPGMTHALEYALELCELTGLRPQDCVMMKVLRNEIKYFAPILNNGFKPNEAVALTKRSFDALIGEERFSHWYLDFAEEISH